MKWTRESVSTINGAKTIMVGRKRRQNIKRQPNGQPSRTRDIDPRAVAQLMPHRRLVPTADAHDPKAESLIGRLCLNGWVPEILYEAAIQHRDIVLRYRAVINAPKASETSMSGVIVGPWGGSSDMDDAEALRRRTKYTEIVEAIEEGAGRRGLMAVSACVIHERPGFQMAPLICGLSHAASHLGLLLLAKSVSAINRH